MSEDQASDLRTREAASSSEAAAAAGAESALPGVTRRVWKGGTENWYDASNWRPRGGENSYPLPGDSAVIRRGTAVLSGDEAKDDGAFEATHVTLRARLEADQATLGSSFAITAAGRARLIAEGTSSFEGALTLKAHAHATLGSIGSGNLILARSFAIDTPNPGARSDLNLSGHVTLDGVASFATPQGVSLTNDATVDVIGVSDAGSLGLQGTIKGDGAFDLGLASDLKTAGSVGRGQTFDFTSAGAQLDIGDLKGFSGHISNFGSGDAIGLTGVGYASDLAASYNAATSTLSVTNTATNQVVASLGHVAAQAGPLYVAADSKDGGISIGYSPSPASTLSQADITASAAAVRANVAQTMDVPGTSTPITGAGVKIGIISTSFDNTGTAAANEAAGYLPAVNVLADNPTGTGDDEGQAMAEEVHAIAPGASIDFCAADDGTSTSSQATLGQAVQALANDHCNIIVDDISTPGGPIYQVAGPDATAVQNAVNSGVNYFTSAGNEGQAFLNQTFTPSSRTVGGLKAQQFDNGTPYERFTVGANSNTTAYLQWAAPYANPNGGNAPQDLSLEVFNAHGQYVATSSPLAVGANEVSAAELQVPTSSKAQSYYFAVVQNNGTPTPSAFHVTLENAGTGTGPGGVIDDPEAGMGSDLVGSKLVPGVNTVGASFYGESAAYGQTPTANETYSSYGADTQILYAPNGSPLASPETSSKPEFSAPDGTATTVPGSFSNGFFGTSAAAPNAAAVAALMLQANPNLTTSQVTSLLEQSAIPFGNASQSGAGLIQADRAVQAAIAARTVASAARTVASAAAPVAPPSPTLAVGQGIAAPDQSAVVSDAAAPVCFAAGTRIRTPRGEIAVEDLAVGDLVVTSAGATREICWLGHRAIDCRSHPRPDTVRPVRIAAHAFGDNRPARDLRVSPGHSICVDVVGEVLIPAVALVEGIAIVQEAVERVTYWHVELADHDVILAEGLPCESYLEMGNRGFFVEAATTALWAMPDAPAASHADFCRPYLHAGPVVAAVRGRLAALAAARGASDVERARCA